MRIKVWAESLLSLINFSLPEKEKRLPISVLVCLSEKDQYIKKDCTKAILQKKFKKIMFYNLPWEQHVPKGELSKKEVERFEDLFVIFKNLK